MQVDPHALTIWLPMTRPAEGLVSDDQMTEQQPVWGNQASGGAVRGNEAGRGQSEGNQASRGAS